MAKHKSFRGNLLSSLTKQQSHPIIPLSCLTKLNSPLRTPSNFFSHSDGVEICNRHGTAKSGKRFKTRCGWGTLTMKVPGQSKETRVTRSPIEGNFSWDGRKNYEKSKQADL